MYVKKHLILQNNIFCSLFTKKQLNCETPLTPETCTTQSEIYGKSFKISDNWFENKFLRNGSKKLGIIPEKRTNGD